MLFLSLGSTHNRIRTAMGVVIIFQSSRPSQSFWSSVAIPFGLAYYVLTAALTIVATILMAFRLLMARRQYIRAMGKQLLDVDYDSF